MFKRRILLTMPLVIALALIMSVSTSANSKSILTDAEMSSIYGGAKCVLHITGETACAGLELSGDCSGSDDPNVPDPWPGGQGGCDGSWKTTCKQSEKYCIDTPESGYCWDHPDIPCEGTYEFWTCGIQQQECEADYSATYDCSGRTPGTKRDAQIY